MSSRAAADGCCSLPSCSRSLALHAAAPVCARAWLHRAGKVAGTSAPPQVPQGVAMAAQQPAAQKQQQQQMHQQAGTPTTRLSKAELQEQCRAGSAAQKELASMTPAEKTQQSARAQLLQQRISAGRAASAAMRGHRN